MNRIFSLNEIATEFAVEELEPRLEMQMLGVGTDPGIILTSRGSTVVPIVTPDGMVVLL